MAFVRLVVIGFVFLSIIYVIAALFSRSVRRENLEKEWDEDNPGVEDPAARDRFVSAGMEEYHASFRPKLLLLIYVVPVILVATIHIVTTYY